MRGRRWPPKAAPQGRCSSRGDISASTTRRARKAGQTPVSKAHATEDRRRQGGGDPALPPAQVPGPGPPPDQAALRRPPLPGNEFLRRWNEPKAQIRLLKWFCPVWRAAPLPRAGSGRAQGRSLWETGGRNWGARQPPALGPFTYSLCSRSGNCLLPQPAGEAPPGRRSLMGSGDRTVTRREQP